MRKILSLALILGWNLQAVACMDLSGVYEFHEESCDKEIIPELTLPTDQGKISLKKDSIITIKQFQCDQYNFSVVNAEDNFQSAELTKIKTPNFQFSKYGIIINEELKKIKKDSLNQSITGRKISINSQWNLDLIGNGNLVLKFKQEIRNHSIFKPRVRDINQVCELFLISQ